MIETRYFVESSLLPVGFEYPTDFVEYAKQNPGEVLKPWRFLWLDEPEFMLDGLKQRYPLRDLVPFARLTGSDDIACFQRLEGIVTVAIIHDFAEPGWELRGTLSSFEKWLAFARVEARENEDDEDD